MDSNIYWKAIYRDGTIFPQIKEDGTENKYPDINRDNLEFFDLYEKNSNRLLFRLHLEEGRRLIVRCRDLKKGYIRDGVVRTSEKIWMVGWQWSAKCSDCNTSRNVQDIAWIFEDGHVELTGQFKACPFNTPGNFMECEREVNSK